MNIRKELSKAKNKILSVSEGSSSKKATVMELNNVLSIILDIISFLESDKKVLDAKIKQPKQQTFKEISGHSDRLFSEKLNIDQQIESLKTMLLSTIDSISSSIKEEDNQQTEQTQLSRPGLYTIPKTEEDEPDQQPPEFQTDKIFKENILKLINFKVKSENFNLEIKKTKTERAFELEKRGDKMFIVINSENLKFKAVQPSDLALSIHFSECIFRAICRAYFNLTEDETEERIDLFFDNNFDKLSLIK